MRMSGAERSAEEEPSQLVGGDRTDHVEVVGEVFFTQSGVRTTVWRFHAFVS